MSDLLRARLLDFSGSVIDVPVRGENGELVFEPFAESCTPAYVEISLAGGDWWRVPIEHPRWVGAGSTLEITNLFYVGRGNEL